MATLDDSDDHPKNIKITRNVRTPKKLNTQTTLHSDTIHADGLDSTIITANIPPTHPSFSSTTSNVGIRSIRPHFFFPLPLQIDLNPYVPIYSQQPLLFYITSPTHQTIILLVTNFFLFCFLFFTPSFKNRG